MFRTYVFETASYNVCSSAGLDTSRTFMSGHSLGGVVLAWYVRDHPDSSSGVLLFGSWLSDDDYPDHTFPVPVLAAIGTLDGNGVPNIMPEAEDAAAANEVDPDGPGQAVWAVDRVNHAQVAKSFKNLRPEIDALVPIQYQYSLAQYSQI